MLNNMTRTRKLLAIFSLTLGFLGVFNLTHSPKVSALGCYPGANAAYFNATVAVRVLNPDGSFRKWSNDFNFRATAADPKPFGNKWHVPENGIAWSGRPGFPTNTADFNARAGGAGTESCPTWDGTNATTFVFGDSTDGKAYLACNWGSWGGGAGNDHGLAFFFNPLSIGDAEGSGYWVPGSNGYVEPGGRRDANNQTAVITFVYQLTSVENEPQGNLEQADCNAISGWAKDLDAWGGRVEVHMYFDGPPGVGRGLNIGLTNLDRPDVGGLNGFSISASDPRIPVDLFDGDNHTVNVYAINVGGGNNQQVNNSPKTITTCSPPAPSISTADPVASATFSPDSEDPTSVTFSASVNMTGRGYTVSAARYYYYIKSGTLTEITINRSDLVASPSSNPISQNITASTNFGGIVTMVNPVSKLGLDVGDRICVRTAVDKSQVSINYRGTESTLSGSKDTANQGCVRLDNKPYLSVYGSDVKAGGDISGPTCNYSNGSISAYTKGGTRGSGVQLAAFAMGSAGNISNFNTAFNRTSYPLPPADLQVSRYGMNSGACIHDYYQDRNTTPWTGLNASTEGKYFVDGSITLPAMNIGEDQHVYLYVKGNVTINGPITMDTGPWSDKSKMPSLYIVSNGNIYIDNDVTKLAGTFVAQQTGKKIYTCSEGSNPYELSEVDQMFNSCGKQLVVDGAFIAKQVIFGRTFGTLRKSGSDNPYGSSSDKNCSSSVTGQSTNTCAAEVFRFNPVLYLAESPISTESITGSSSDYEFASSLPPLL